MGSPKSIFLGLQRCHQIQKSKLPALGHHRAPKTPRQHSKCCPEFWALISAAECPKMSDQRTQPAPSAQSPNFQIDCFGFNGTLERPKLPMTLQHCPKHLDRCHRAPKKVQVVAFGRTAPPKLNLIKSLSNHRLGPWHPGSENFQVAVGLIPFQNMRTSSLSLKLSLCVVGLNFKMKVHSESVSGDLMTSTAFHSMVLCI